MAHKSHSAGDPLQVPTKYVKKGASGKLVFEVKKAAEDSIYLGYWPLYPISRMDDNVAKWQKDPRVRLQVVGKSIQGRDINLLTIGTATTLTCHLLLLCAVL